MSDPTIYLYTSLTAGSSHIVTATARLETILKANKLPFKAIDVATDDAARKLWGRKSKGKKLPGLVKFGTIVGDLEEIEEWNEFGELRMQVIRVEDPDNFIGSSAATAAAAGAPDTAATTTAPAATPAENPAPKQSTIKIQSPPSKETKKDDSITVAMRQAGEEAASKAKETTTTEPKQPEPSTESPAQEIRAEKKDAESKESNNDGPQTQDQPETKAKTQSEEQNVGPRRISNPPAPEVAVTENGPGDDCPPTAIVPEAAAESSENFRADNAEALGLVEHHRASTVSATSNEERRQVARDLRQSVSEARGDIFDSLKAEDVVSEEEEEH